MSAITTYNQYIAFYSYCILKYVYLKLSYRMDAQLFFSANFRGRYCCVNSTLLASNHIIVSYSPNRTQDAIFQLFLSSLAYAVNSAYNHFLEESEAVCSRPRRRRRISPTYRVEFPWRRSRRLIIHAAVDFFRAAAVAFFNAITELF